MMGIKKSTRRGFTIVEILVVTVVVGILAGIVVVSYNASQRQAQDTRTVAMINSVAQALNSYKTAKGVFPTINGSVTPEETIAGVQTCLGDGFKDGSCGGNKLVGECSGLRDQYIQDYGEQWYTDMFEQKIRTNSNFIQALKQFIKIEVPTIEHPEQSYSYPYTEECDLATYFTGPIYSSLCKVGMYNGVPYTSLSGACRSGGTTRDNTAYEITYFLSEKSSNCGLPGAYNITEQYGATGTATGSICKFIGGERVTCSDEFCPEIWDNY